MLTLMVSDGRFKLGEIITTANALSRLSRQEILDALQRHASGDWETLPADDAQLNDAALREGNRILSAYGEGARRFWIVTESDPSVTTILMPEDY